MKKYLIEILDFFKYKLENDKCTDEDMREAFKLLQAGVVCGATIKDIADYYGQSESNVRNVIARKSTSKSKRVVLYDFMHISKIIPKGWKY